MIKYKSKEAEQRVAQGRLKGIELSSKRRIEREKEYYKNPTLCPQCEKPIEYKKKNSKNIFCSSSCSATHSNIRRTKKYEGII
jgi:hypothetical protein